MFGVAWIRALRGGGLHTQGRQWLYEIAVSKIFGRPAFDDEFFFETSNGRLPPEDSSDRPQTLGKHVSGDPQHLIFRCQKMFFDIEKRNVVNRLKRVFPKFEPDRSHPRGVNGRLKFSRFERRTSRLNTERRVFIRRMSVQSFTKKFPWTSL